MSERLRRRSTPSPYDRELCLIGARLRTARESAGLTQLALAVKVRCSQQTISAYESGRILPRSIGVVVLAAALGVEPESLCRRTTTTRRKAS